MNYKEARAKAKSMLWAYRNTVIEKIESYTKDEAIDSIKSGEAFDYWIREYFPSDKNIYGDD